LKNDLYFWLISLPAPILKKPVVIYALSVLIACVVTLINGFPILYSDTSTYISSGFELEAPFDRPITYGILLRIFSLNGLSFLFVPLFQSALFIYVISKTIECFVGNQNKAKHTFVATIVIIAFTGFAWDINQLIADFFTSIGFLSLLCILYDKNIIKENIVLFIIFFFASASHISNTFIYLACLFIILLFRKTFLPTMDLKLFKKKIAILLVLLAISYVIMASAISKSKDVFYNGSLAQKGILQEILKDKCGITDFRLCQYKDSIPLSFEGFVWKPSSPLYKLGGWKELRPELKTISGISLGEKKYFKMQVAFTFANLWDQIFMTGIGDGNGAFDANTLLIQRIQKYSVLDDTMAVTSRQNAKQFLGLERSSAFYFLTMLVSLLILVVQLIRKKTNTVFILLIFLVVVFILINFFLIAFSSEIANRHGVKLYWIFTLLAYLTSVSKKSLKME
jgi:hypothetical protein